MRFRQPLWWAVPAVIAGAAGAVLCGDVDDSVDATAAFEIWGDVVRDVDQFGMSLARISDQEEMRIGRVLAAEFAPAGRSPRQAAVESVGKSLVPHVRRRGIEYRFHVVDWHDINAFALPGGQIFVTTGMLDFVESDAELASVLAHEIAHVDQRHAIEQLFARITLEKVIPDDLAALVDLAPAIVRAGYRKYQELEADAAGLRIATAAGYDPWAAVDTFRRLAVRQHEPAPGRARDPVSEAGDAVLGGLGSYLDSHPPTAERIERLERLIRSRWRR